MRLMSLIQKFAVALGLGCVFAAASLTAFVLHLDLPRGRRMVSEVVGGALISQLRGSFAIAGIERLRPGVAVVRDFEVKDEQGRVTLRVSRVTLRAAWLGMARELVVAPNSAKLVFDAVELEHAEAYLFDDRK